MMGGGGVGVEATLRGTDNTLHYWEWRDTLDEMRDELVMIEGERRREREMWQALSTAYSYD